MRRKGIKVKITDGVWLEKLENLQPWIPQELANDNQHILLSTYVHFHFMFLQVIDNTIPILKCTTEHLMNMN